MKGRLDRLVRRVGFVAMIGMGLLALVLVITSIAGVAYFVYRHRSSDQAANVSTIVNNSFAAPFTQPATFKIVVPLGAINPRVVGGFRVSSGGTTNFYIVTEGQLEQWSNGAARPAISQRQGVASAKIRQPLSPGTYYLLFTSPDVNSTVTVAAEFYSKYD